jgi:hypothetical protein
MNRGNARACAGPGWLKRQLRLNGVPGCARRDGVEVRQINAGVAKTIRDHVAGMGRHAVERNCLVFRTHQTLGLHGNNDPAVSDQGRPRIVTSNNA